MNQVPDFFRTETWHPLSVHFPIVLLSFATFAYVVSLFLKGQNEKIWWTMAFVLLIAGVITAWIGIYTGGMADGVVSRKICDPTVLKDHEIGAYTLSILFTIALAIMIIQYFNWLAKAKKVFTVITLLLMVAGTGFLVYAGHLGATIVYQQGGGVYQPTEDCSEFN